MSARILPPNDVQLSTKKWELVRAYRGLKPVAQKMGVDLMKDMLKRPSLSRHEGPALRLVTGGAKWARSSIRLSKP